MNKTSLAKAIAIVFGSIAALIGAAYLLAIYPIAIYIQIAFAIGLTIALVYQLIRSVYEQIEYNKQYKK